MDGARNTGPRDFKSPIPDNRTIGPQNQGRHRTPDHLPGLPADDNGIAQSRQPGSTQDRGKGLALPQSVQHALQTFAARRCRCTARADQRHGQGTPRNRSVGRDLARLVNVQDRERHYRLRGLTEPRSRSAQQGCPGPRPAKADIAICRILYPAEPPPSQPHPQFLAAFAQEWTHQHQTAAVRPCRRRRPSAQPAEGRALRLHPVTFCDVVSCMGEQDDTGSRGPRGIGKKAVTGRSCSGAQPRRRFWARPDKTPPVSPEGPRLPLGLTTPGRAVGTQLMVHSQCQNPAPSRPGPIADHSQKCDGIPAAGQGNSNRASVMMKKPLVQPRMNALGQAIVDRIELAQRHPARVLTSAAWALTPALEPVA